MVRPGARPTDGGSATASASEVWVVELDDAITPATANYFIRAARRRARRERAALVVRLDTPGGLDQAMRDMIKEILASRDSRRRLRGTERLARRERGHLSASTRAMWRRWRRRPTSARRRRSASAAGRSPRLPSQPRRATTTAPSRRARPRWSARSSTTPSPISAASRRCAAAMRTGPKLPCARRPT